MDDRTMHRVPGGRAVIRRRCEAGRFQQELLARAYQHVAGEVRRTLVNRAMPAAAAQQGHRAESSTAARCLLAKGA